MIKVKIEIKNNSLKKINISGHANYSDYGKDIVCASCSSILVTTVNAIIEIDESAIEYLDNGNIVTINILKDNDIVNKLLNNMLSLFKDLTKDYKDYIKIIKEES